MSVAIPYTKSNLRTCNVLDVFDVFACYEMKKLRAENESLRKRLEENKKFKEMAEDAAHDIRSPLLVLHMGLNPNSA